MKSNLLLRFRSLIKEKLYELYNLLNNLRNKKKLGFDMKKVEGILKK